MKFIVLLLAILFAMINSRTETETESETGVEALSGMCSGKTYNTLSGCNSLRICVWDAKTNTCNLNPEFSS